MNKPKLTYYIGAGASIQAIPVYDKFTKHFITFLDSLLLLVQEYNDTSYTKRKVQALIEKLRAEMIDQPSLTVDVFGHRLYKRNQNPLEYHFFKILLNLYIVAEQLRTTADFSHLKLAHNDIIVDPRYEHLLHRIITKGFVESNINFISWNYDNQFELAYALTYNSTLKDAQNSLNILPSSGLGFSPPGDSCILKLNGATNLYFDTNKRNLLNIFDLYRERFDGSIVSAFYQVLIQNCETAATDFYFDFAWERGKYFEDKILKQAQKIIGETDELVVIGYSFPEYNLDIDRLILSNVKHIKKVYLQVKSEDFPAIQARLGFISSAIQSRAQLWDHLDVFLYPL